MLEQKLVVSATINTQKDSNLQFFFEDNGRYTENSSKLFTYSASDIDQAFSASSRLKNDMDKIRFDPASVEGSIRIKEITFRSVFSNLTINGDNYQSFLLDIQGANNISADDSGYLQLQSISNDPILEFKIPSYFQTMQWITRITLAIVLTSILFLLNKNAATIKQITFFLTKRANSIPAIKDHPKTMAFLVALGIFCLYNMGLTEPAYFCCDAKGYWDYSQVFKTEHGFSFDNFDSSLRGYLLPFIIFTIRELANFLSISEFKLFFFINSLFTAFSIAIVIPSVFEKLFSAKVNFWKIIIFSGIYFFFWRGFLIYPMADTWSIFFIFIAIYFIILQKEKGFSAVNLILIGVFLGMALNFRPIYIASLFIAIFFILFQRHGSHFKRFFAAALVMTGCLAPLIPQIKINQTQFGTLSPTVQTNIAYSGGDLYLTQLFFGSSIQRHECAVFLDYQGDALLKSEGINNYQRLGENYSYSFVINEYKYSDYISMVFSHPIDFASIYTKHILNGIGVFNSNIYECSISSKKMIFSFLLWLLSFISCLVLLINKRINTASISLIILIIPTLLTIPTAIEARYFLPFHIMIYAILALNSSHSLIYQFLLERKFKIGLFSSAALLVFIMHIGQMYASMHTPLGEMKSSGWMLKHSPRTIN